MDISDTLAPKSDQLDAVDLLGSPPRIFTITEVSRGNSEQPVNVHLAEFPRVWRPGKTMRRVLAHLWGKDASQWVGKRVELYGDPNVMMSGEKVGGTRISRMSHIDGPQSVPVLVRRGKPGSYKVKPLPDDAAPTAEPAAEPTADDVAAQSDVQTLYAMYRASTDPEVQQQIKDRVAELQAADQPGQDELPGGGEA